MKWVTGLLEGMYIAVIILVIAVLVVSVFWVGALAAEWVEALQASATNVIAMVCIFFVVCFGLFYSFWSQGE